MKDVNNGFYRFYGKRILDIIGSFFGLIILSPVFVIVAILVRIKLGSPIIFKQERPGKDEQIFTMYKFRTMIDETNTNGVTLPDSDRLTDFGRILRSTSLDELPELWNILKGEMSLIGPRPLLIEYLPLYTKAEKKRHDVRPGLTGLSQISGRNATEWNERLRQDQYYVENLSFYLDLKILIQTFRVIVLREGISSPTSETKETLTEIRK